jgi:hypothetical protein
VETRSRMAELAARNAIAAVLGEPALHAVNHELSESSCSIDPRGPAVPC